MMSVNTAGLGDVLQQGYNGMQGSSRSMVESANELVRAGTVDRAETVHTDIVEPMVNIQKQQQLFDASASVVKVADEALGALIDIKT